MQAEPGHWYSSRWPVVLVKVGICKATRRKRGQEMSVRPGEYFMLQRFLPEIALGKPHLVVAGRIIGSYLRIPTNDLHANLAQHEAGLKPRPLRIGPVKNCRRVVNSTYRVCGHRYGGRYTHGSEHRQPRRLGTLNRLYGHDFGPAVVEAAEAFILKN